MITSATAAAVRRVRSRTPAATRSARIAAPAATSTASLRGSASLSDRPTTGPRAQSARARAPCRLQGRYRRGRLGDRAVCSSRRARGAGALGGRGAVRMRACTGSCGLAARGVARCLVRRGWLARGVVRCLVRRGWLARGVARCLQAGLACTGGCALPCTAVCGFGCEAVGWAPRPACTRRAPPPASARNLLDACRAPACRYQRARPMPGSSGSRDPPRAWPRRPGTWDRPCAGLASRPVSASSPLRALTAPRRRRWCIRPRSSTLCGAQPCRRGP